MPSAVKPISSFAAIFLCLEHSITSDLAFRIPASVSFGSNVDVDPEHITDRGDNINIPHLHVGLNLVELNVDEIAIPSADLRNRVHPNDNRLFVADSPNVGTEHLVSSSRQLMRATKPPCLRTKEKAPINLKVVRSLRPISLSSHLCAEGLPASTISMPSNQQPIPPDVSSRPPKISPRDIGLCHAPHHLEEKKVAIIWKRGLDTPKPIGERAGHDLHCISRLQVLRGQQDAVLVSPGKQSSHGRSWHDGRPLIGP